MFLYFIVGKAGRPDYMGLLKIELGSRLTGLSVAWKQVPGCTVELAIVHCQWSVV